MRTRRRSVRGLLLGALLAAGGAWAGRALQAPAFSHRVHVPLFPGSCTTCHLGAAEPGTAFYPSPERCAACHDGVVERRIVWTAGPAAPPSNLRFTHERHATATADSVGCVQCHALADTGRTIARRVVERCIGCHVPGIDHLAVANDQCRTCHVALAEATGLAEDAIARFPVPVWHRDAGFEREGHARIAEVRGRDGGRTVAPGCATCHARDFCMNCHVNAPEVPAIQALERDPRSLRHGFRFGAPPSHAATGFAVSHGREARRSATSCAVCHTQTSCTVCHVGTPAPRPVAALHRPGPGRAAGAQLTRRPPASHVADFREGHGRTASGAPRSCATCHLQTDCFSCHRPDPARAASGGDYHPADFLVRHPAAAYARRTTCSDCHNPQQFCSSCHAQAGLAARRSLGGAAFHDAQGTFIVGHGQAARQALESCVSCHVERDCTACHSSVGRGFRFNPHGPGFDPVRLFRRNPEMCIACHGQAIPGIP